MARIRNRDTSNSNTRNCTSDRDVNAYEEARKQRLQDNLKKFQDLGISNISKCLSDVTSTNKESEDSPVKRKSKSRLETLQLRRSSRERGSVPSYREVEIDLREYRRSYSRRSIGEGRMASYEERLHAMQCAEELQSNLTSGNPSFLKSMVRSHVSSCFWLGLPNKFCKDHLPQSDLKMALEDENGSEHDIVYIGSRTGISGGWRGFAIDHGLEDGDALVFELSELTKFKVYIVKASQFSKEDDEEKIVKTKGKNTEKSKKNEKSIENENEPVPKKLEQDDGPTQRAKRAMKRSKRE